jgi:ribonuclease Z
LRPGLLVEAGSHRILVDCGEGTQRQLLRGGAGFRRLDRILLTHGHFDHVLGIPGLFSTLRLRQSADAMTIHGSRGNFKIGMRTEKSRLRRSLTSLQELIHQLSVTQVVQTD